jgi:hypothetical protein
MRIHVTSACRSIGITSISKLGCVSLLSHFDVDGIFWFVYLVDMGCTPSVAGCVLDLPGSCACNGPEPRIYREVRIITCVRIAAA